MDNKEKLDNLVSDFKKKFRGENVEEEIKRKWRWLAAQGSIQSRKAKYRY